MMCSLSFLFVVALHLQVGYGSSTASTVLSADVGLTKDCPLSNLSSTSTFSPPFDSIDDQLLDLVLGADYDALDPTVLPNCVAELKARGAHRCWHKHSTFLDHLLGVHNMLRLWGQGKTIGRVGLFHSAYSNSYVNLALFDPAIERDLMQGLIGSEAEELVHLFCIIDRQEVVVNTLLKQGYIPMEGLTVPHLRNPNENVFLSAETLRLLVVFTMADIADQYFGWQDDLFGGGSMLIPGKDDVDLHQATAIWPGLSKPGLWMSYVSNLARVARTFDPNVVGSTAVPGKEEDQRIRDIPPVFADGTQSLSMQDEEIARDLYWSVVTGEMQTRSTISDDDAISRLRACTEKNPWAYEPFVLLAQKLMHKNDLAGALEAADRALLLQKQWGTAWDKRLPFGAWVAWTRVIHQRARDNLPWPRNSWDVNNFGLVQ